MKKLFFILALLFSNFAFSQGKFDTQGDLAPTGSYGIVKARNLRGGYLGSVYDTLARNAIPLTYRDSNTLVYTRLDSTMWMLKGGIQNSNWAIFSTGGSSVIDSLVYSTRAWRQKGVDSVQANITAGLALKLNLTDSSLYASRGRLYKVTDSLGGILGTKLSILDSATFSTKAWRQKGVDSVSALISPRITDSLRALVRLRAQGSGGIDVQNSSGTSVASFGSGGTTNISLNGSTNVNARLNVTDSIVGVNQRLTGNIQAATFNGSALGSYAFRSSGLAELSGATFTGAVSITGGNTTIRPASGYNFLFQNSGTTARINYLNDAFSANVSAAFRATDYEFQKGDGAAIFNLASTGAATFSSSATVQGALTANGKATFTDSIVGVNQRLTGGLSIAGFNAVTNDGGSATYIPLWTSGGRIKNSSIYQDPAGAAIGINQTTGLTSLLNVAGTIKNQGIYFDTSSAASNPALGMLVYTTANNKLFFKGPSGFAANINTGSLTADREFTFPNSTGTIALISNLSSYLPLTGGTLSGNLTLNGGDLQINTRRYIYLGNAANSLFPYIRNTDGDGIGLYNNAGNALLEATTANGITTNGRAFAATGQGNNITIGVDSSVTTTTYTLVLGDAGYLKRCDNASPITITVPANSSVAFPIGTVIYFSQKGAGKVTLSPATNVTLNSSGGLLGTAAQHSTIAIMKVNTNVWNVVGERG